MKTRIIMCSLSGAILLLIVALRSHWLFQRPSHDLYGERPASLLRK